MIKFSNLAHFFLLFFGDIMIFDGLENTVAEKMRSVPPNGLESVEGFPILEYLTNLGRYEEYENWFTGAALDVEDIIENKKIKRYPIRINPIQGACSKHAYALFGETPDDGRPLVCPKVKPGAKNKRKLANEAEEALNTIWYESGGRAMMLENGLMSQIYGGCVFKINWFPFDDLRTIKVGIEAISPKFFIGYPKSNNSWYLSEAWFVSLISPREALTEYGITVEDPNVETVFKVEYWNEAEYKVIVDGYPAFFQNIKTPSGEKIPMAGKNEWGFVPAVYIPHVRAGGFYGHSLIPNLRGLVAEMNARAADLGDAVSTETHSVVAIKNVSSVPTEVEISPGLRVVDLKSNSGFSDTNKDPNMWAVKRDSVSAPMVSLIDSVLYRQFRRDAYLPAVADGEDEGSQRSAATLVTRMWPLVSHVETERYFWTVGLDILSRMMLRILVIKKQANITEDHLGMRTYQQWAPVLPKDREQVITEITTRKAQGLGSTRHLLTMAGDVENIDEEMEEIEKEKNAAFAREKAQQSAIEGQSNNGSNQSREEVNKDGEKQNAPGEKQKE